MADCMASIIRVLEAEDAKAALKVPAEHPDVRVLFTDIDRPGALDGLDLAGDTPARWPDIKLIVPSGRPRPSDRDIPDQGRFVAEPYAPDLRVEQTRKVLAGSLPRSAAE